MKRYTVTLNLLLNPHKEDDEQPELKRAEYTVYAKDETSAKAIARSLDKSHLSVYESWCELDHQFTSALALIQCLISDTFILENVVITSLEGGSNYWYWLNCSDIWYTKAKSYDKELAKKTGRKELLPLSERMVKCIQLIDGFEIPIYDCENPDERLGILSLKNFILGCLLCKEKYPIAWRHIISEDFDATDADILFQLTVLGDYVYG